MLIMKKRNTLLLSFLFCTTASCHGIDLEQIRTYKIHCAVAAYTCMLNAVCNYYFHDPEITSDTTNHLSILGFLFALAVYILDCIDGDNPIWV